MKALTFRDKEKIHYDSVSDPKSLFGHAASPISLDSGTVMSHEAVGMVLEVGRGVRNFKKGDRVFSPIPHNLHV